MEIRVLTLNTWKGDGAYRARVRAMGQGIGALAPDVVLLQEVLSAPDLGLCTAEALTVGAGLDDYAFAPARAKMRRVEAAQLPTTSGLAILTRGSIVETRVVPLPSVDVDGERIAQIAEIETEGSGPITVVNTHLSHLGGRDDLRQAQMEAIVAAVNGTPGPVIFGGDMNAEPGDAPLDWLMERSGRPWRASTAVNHFPTLQPMTGDDAADRPCIDHLFVSGDGVDLTTVRPALADPDPDGITPSDHIGVFAKVRRG